jgi:hypothetical protein
MIKTSHFYSTCFLIQSIVQKYTGESLFIHSCCYHTTIFTEFHFLSGMKIVMLILPIKDYAITPHFTKKVILIIN